MTPLTRSALHALSACFFGYAGLFVACVSIPFIILGLCGLCVLFHCTFDQLFTAGFFILLIYAVCSEDIDAFLKKTADSISRRVS